MSKLVQSFWFGFCYSRHIMAGVYIGASNHILSQEAEKEDGWGPTIPFKNMSLLWFGYKVSSKKSCVLKAWSSIQCSEIGALGKWLDNEVADITDGLIHWWINNWMDYCERWSLIGESGSLPGMAFKWYILFLVLSLTSSLSRSPFLSPFPSPTPTSLSAFWLPW
jgi:hypothetical protein